MNEFKMQLLILLVCFAAPCLSGRVRFSDDSDRRDVPSQYYQQQDRNIDKAEFYSQYLQSLHSINPDWSRYNADYPRYVQDLTRYNAENPRYVQRVNGYNQQGVNGYNLQERTRDSADYSRYFQGVNGYNQQDRTRDSAEYSRYSQGGNGYSQQGVNGYNQQERDRTGQDRTRDSADYSRYSQGGNGYSQQGVNGYNHQDRTWDSADYSRYSQGGNGYSQQGVNSYNQQLLQEGSAFPSAIGASFLRQGNTNTAGEQTLGSMGETIVLPGSGPTIDLQVEGDLAEKMKKMTLAQLAMAPDTDSIQQNY